MNLDDNQKQQVAKWLDGGLSLAQIQKRLEEDFEITMTYMEVKFLVSDLDLKPKDPEPPKPAEPEKKPAESAVPTDDAESDLADEDLPPYDDEPAPGTGGKVTVAMDQIARPGAMISGKVTFSNGKTSEWMLDQMGRLGVVPSEDGYKPSQMDLQQFQIELQKQIQKMGY